MRAITATVALALAGLTLAACDTPEHVSTAAAPVATASPVAPSISETTAPPASGTTASPTSESPTSASSTAASPPVATATRGSTGPRAADPCPVTAKVLYRALRADKNMSERTAPATGLQSATCYQGFATAKTIVENVDPAGVLFKYDPDTRVWRPINLGSGGYCEGYTSAVIAQRLGNGC
ncbi:hypothetical protein AB0J83_43375 [Actinoplanes sp. NPDC049596]|uniref:hypothetical protein n=1 Tax=unclassified Actinoplanes TaxID=2626549 RepID=UPI0034492126